MADSVLLKGKVAFLGEILTHISEEEILIFNPQGKKSTCLVECGELDPSNIIEDAINCDLIVR